MNNLRAKRNELLDYIDKVSFAADDARLYLDTHPNCAEALSFFKMVTQKREAAIREYTSLFGPITAYDTGNCDTWRWNEGPMPWQAAYRERGR